MLVALWIINALLALAFFGAGAMKLVRSRDALISGGQAYVEDFGNGAVQAIGAAEVLGALGLILPLATGVATIITPVSAAALAVLLLAATIVHLRREETPGPSVVLMVLAIASAMLGFLVVL